MYEPGIIYQRTPEENRNVFLAWKRADKAFFAAGACHILGYLFVSLHRHEGFELVHIHSRDKGGSGHHMYAANGVWAFDFNGWTREEELLKEYIKAYKAKYPGWTYKRMIVPYDWMGFGEYLLKIGHRPPEYFPELPWRRAHEYIKQFPNKPPVDIVGA